MTILNISSIPISSFSCFQLLLHYITYHEPSSTVFMTSHITSHIEYLIPSYKNLVIFYIQIFKRWNYGLSVKHSPGKSDSWSFFLWVRHASAKPVCCWKCEFWNNFTLLKLSYIYSRCNGKRVATPVCLHRHIWVDFDGKQPVAG